MRAHSTCASKTSFCPCRCALDKEDARTWHVDPMRCALPEAPSLQLFNLYGVGLPTERSYQYVHYRTQRVRPRLRGARKSDRMRF